MNELYTLEDISMINNPKKKKNLNFKYKIIFEDEKVFPEILKKLPNKNYLSAKIIKNLTKKIKKRKNKNNTTNTYKCQRSIFSIVNTSNIGDCFFNDQNKSFNQDTFNLEKYQNLNSINNYDESQRKSLSFLINNKYTQQKNLGNDNSNNINFSNFNNFKRNIDNFELGNSEKKNNKGSSKKNSNVFLDKKIEKNINEDKEGKKEVNNEVGNFSESNKTKNSKNYDQGLMNLLKQIKNLDK